MVFRDPTEADRVWVIFDWDAAAPPILHEAGHIGKPQAAVLAGKYPA
jgi:hypothetical protein